MAQVQAYHKVAMNYFVNNLFRSIQARAFTKIRSGLGTLSRTDDMSSLFSWIDRGCSLTTYFGEEPQREIRLKGTEKLNPAPISQYLISFVASSCPWPA